MAVKIAGNVRRPLHSTSRLLDAPLACRRQPSEEPHHQDERILFVSCEIVPNPAPAEP